MEKTIKLSNCNTLYITVEQYDNDIFSVLLCDDFPEWSNNIFIEKFVKGYNNAVDTANKLMNNIVNNYGK